MTDTQQSGAESALDLDKLEALARAATPGEWTYFPKPKYKEHHVSVPIEGSGMKQALFDDGCRTERPEADARFIAATNPAAVLALLALARRAIAPHAAAPATGALVASKDEQENLSHVMAPFAPPASQHEAGISAWISVADRLPEIDKLVLVYSPPTKYDHPGEVNIGFDCIDPNDDDRASWLNHNEHYEHYSCVAKTEGSTGPSEHAPYTHWMPLPLPPAQSQPAGAARQGGDTINKGA